MKKIITLIAALFMFIGIAAAQSVEHGKLFHNTYVGIDGGIFTPMVKSFNQVSPTFGIEFGKNITPVVGVSLEGQMYPSFADKKMKLTNVVGNFKINLSNWFGGYNGEPRTVEFVLVPGIGWMHDFNNNKNPNYITYNTGAEINFNLGKQKAWQINVKPDVVWHEKNWMGFYPKHADWRLTCGVTYKFGYKNASGNKTHNFTLCESGISETDYNYIYEKYCEALKSKPDTVTVIVEKEVVVEVVNDEFTKPTNMFVEFEKGSSVLSKFWVNRVSEIASYISDDETVVVVVGSADSSTGSNEINKKIANERAESVAKVLRNNGVKNIKVGSVIDINEEPELSRCVLITVE